MSLCIGFGCRARPLEGRPTCLVHVGLTPDAPPCPDGHGPLVFVVVAAVRLGGELSLMYACPSCDYVTQVDHPPRVLSGPDPSGVCTTCGRPAAPHPYRHPVTREPGDPRAKRSQ